jgi:hypothetical protein
MSSNPKHLPTVLTFSSRNLRDDGAAVETGHSAPNQSIDANTAVQRLRAFGRIAAVELVGSDALIYLANSKLKLAVQHENGRLFATRVPEAANIALEQTPEEIVGFLEGEQAVSAQSPQNLDPTAVRLRPRKWRERLNSRGLLVGLAVVALAFGIYRFSPEVPDGLAMVRDPAKITRLNLQFGGRYGDASVAGSTMLWVENGRLVVYPAGNETTPGEPLLKASYRYGLHSDGQVALVVANGAVMESAPDGSLRFNDAVYPRIVAR